MKKTPYAISSTRVQKSPFRTIQKVKEILAKYQNHQSIGFTFMSSLKAMGLIPRSNGQYILSQKYK